MPSLLKEKYQQEIKPALQAKFAYANTMKIPRLKKIIICMGLAEASKDKNTMQAALNELTQLSGQRPLVTKARKSVAGFKLREGQPLGAKVTLRGERMYDFMNRFFNFVCPRIRDFRGFPLKCDHSGNYTLGLEDQQVFPEIDLDQVKRTQGMHITFVTSAQTDEECVELLGHFGLPFKKQEIKS